MEETVPTVLDLKKSTKETLRALAKEYGQRGQSGMVELMTRWFDENRPTVEIIYAPKANAPTALALEVAHNGAVR